MVLARRTGCYGKLPIFGDFLRHNAGSALVRGMDQWFQEGILSCAHSWGASWKRMFAATAPLRFLFVSTQSGEALVGVFVPGVDKAGRHYPFVVFQEIGVSGSAEALRHVPLEYEQILDRAEQLATEGWRGMDPAELYDAVAALGAAASEPMQSVEDHLRTTPAGVVLNRVLQSEDEDGVWVLLQNLVDLVRPGVRPQFVLAQPGGSSALECAVWLSIYRELNGGQPLPSVVMWGRAVASPADASNRPVTRMLFDLVKPVYLQSMLRPDLQNRKLCHLAREGLRSADRIAHARERFGGLLHDDSKSLRQFIDEFVTLARG